MIPLRDANPTRRFPVVTYAIIALNVLVFGYLLSLEPGRATEVVTRYGLVPVTIPGAGVPYAASRALTSLFLHGGWLHLIGNMWFLHIFGDNVEDALGRGRFLLFYLFCGLVAAATQALVESQSAVPMVGASGAIGGVLAAYVMLYPRARVLTLLPLILIFFVEVPAFLFIFVWFGFQVLSGWSTLADGDVSGGVAWWAHIGGFLAGLACLPALREASDGASKDYADYADYPTERENPTEDSAGLPF